MGLSQYTTALDPGLFDRQPSSPPEFLNRAVGRPASERVRKGEKVTIYWPDTLHGRARLILSRSGSRRRYSVPCFRGGERFALCEASEEATGVVLLDACFGVEFQEQPAKIEFELLGEMLEHYPDALVVSKLAKEFWEFKRDHELEDIFFKVRAERLAKLLKPLGFDYRLVATKTLSRNAYYQNAIEMRRHAKLPTKLPNWKNVCANIVAEVPSQARIVTAFLPEDQRLAVIKACLYYGVLSTDFSVPITLDSHIHPPRSTLGGLPWVWELLEKSS